MVLLCARMRETLTLKHARAGAAGCRLCAFEVFSGRFRCLFCVNLRRRRRQSGSSPRRRWPHIRAGLGAPAAAFAASCGFEPKPGRSQILPDAAGAIAAVLYGIETAEAPVKDLLLPGKLATLLPPGALSLRQRPA